MLGIEYNVLGVDHFTLDLTELAVVALLLQRFNLLSEGLKLFALQNPVHRSRALDKPRSNLKRTVIFVI